MRALLVRIEELICVIALSIMTVLAFANVVSRYVFSASFSFSEEITTYLFVLLSMIGSAVAARRGQYLGFTAILDIMRPRTKRMVQIFSFSLGTVYSGAICWYGLQMVGSQMARHQVTAGMQWPEWIFGSFVPIGALFVMVEFLILLINKVKEDPNTSVKGENA